MNERVTPHSYEAEQGTLGGCLLDPRRIADVSELLKPDGSDFWRPDHRLIWPAMVTIDGRGKPVDVILLADELRARSQLEQVGGLQYLIGLQSACPAGAMSVEYAKSVRAMSIRRQAIDTADRIRDLAYGEAETVEELLDTAESGVLALGEGLGGDGFSPLAELVTEATANMVAAAENPGSAAGLTTGFIEIDDITDGLQPSDLIILAARPSMGKTQLSMQIAQNAAIASGRAVAVFSLEMSRQQLTQRLISSQAMVNSRDMRRGFLTDDEWDRVREATTKLHAAPLHIMARSGITTFEMRSQARRLSAKNGGLGLIVVDYLQLARTTEKHDGRVQELSKIGKALKSLAMELNCPILALSQLSRAVEHREDKRPILSDLRESGTIEEDADIVGFIYRRDYYKKKADPRQIPNQPHWQADLPEDDESNVAEVIIGKQRNGPVGTVRLRFSPEFARFENLA